MSSTVKSIKILYPSIMKETAAQQLLDLYNQMQAKEEERAECFMRQQTLENEIDEIRKTLLALSNTYTIEYEEKEVREVTRGEAPVIVESNGTIHA